MVLGIPGINISILRQSTSIGRGQPLLISGRVTFLGFGLPALVRVSLNGPSFDPQTVTFDTFSAPIGGDYNVAVLAQKDGTYEVFAQALPPIVLPIPGDIPLGLPPLAESNRPPLVVGSPVNGGVDADLPGGRQRLTAPPLTRIEIRAPVTVGAPQIPITIGGGGGGFGIPGLSAFPAFPGFPIAPRVPVGGEDQPAQIIVAPVIISPGAEEPTSAQIGEIVGAQIISLELE